jgi:hypothetical protein
MGIGLALYDQISTMYLPGFLSLEFSILIEQQDFYVLHEVASPAFSGLAVTAWRCERLLKLPFLQV